MYGHVCRTSGCERVLIYLIIYCLLCECYSETCVDPLGVEDGSIPADRLSASSEKNDDHGVNRGRLNTQDGGKGAWRAADDNNDQWIQADLGAVTEVSGVITQGRNGKDEWVKSYEVLHSDDGENFVIILGTTGEAEFSGNSDKDTTVTNMFNATVHTRFIRIHPTAWQVHICLRFEVLGCLGTGPFPETCVDPLGVEDGSIPADRLSASSEKGNFKHRAHHGRLNTQEDGKGAWKAENDNDQWIQADLSVVTEVTGVITQGRNGGPEEWVKSYEVHHSVDGETFEVILGAAGATEFSGNSDEDTAVTNMFNAAVYARFIRINPTTWEGYISLRFELLGCPCTDPCPDPTTDVTTDPDTTTETTTDTTTDATTDVTTDTTTDKIMAATTDTADTTTPAARGYFRKVFNSDGTCLLEQRISSSFNVRNTISCAVECLSNSLCEGFVVNNHRENLLCSLLDQSTIETGVTQQGCVTYRKYLNF